MILKRGTKAKRRTHSQPFSLHSYSRMTKRWSLSVCYGMVNVAGVDASILFHSHMVNQGKKPQSRRKLMKKLALEMLRPIAERRLTQATLAFVVQEAVKMIFFILWLFQNCRDECNFQSQRGAWFVFSAEIGRQTIFQQVPQTCVQDHVTLVH